MARAVCVLVFVCSFAGPAFAQDARVDAAQAPLLAAAVSEAAQLPPTVAAPVPVAVELFRSQKRPSALLPMYVTTAALQTLDIVTTSRALERGGVEANPVMGSVVGSRAGFYAAKVGTTAATIWLSEKLWKRNRFAAVAMMIGVNAGMAMVVNHNLHALSQLR
jgi:hypothetical protein